MYQKTGPLNGRWAVAAALAMCLALPAGAQEAGQAEEEEATELGRVEITGTRITRADAEGQPIISISREELDNRGVTSIGEFLQQLTVSGSALNTKFNSSGNFGFPPNGGGVGAGSTQVDLRHLGANRVLVLVDGKRWVHESSASGVSGAVDLNTIPMSIVDRIEVLKDGASTIYGSDAIAGVVNIITRKNYDGTGFTAYYGAYDEGDGETQRYEFSMGKSDAESSVFFSINHLDQNRISAADREISFYPVPGTGVTRGSSGTPQGRFIFVSPDGTDQGGLCPFQDTDGDGTPDTPICDITTPQGSSFPGDVPSFPGDFIPFSSNERFNFAPFNLVLTPSERTSLFAQGQFAMSDNVQFYAKYLATMRKSVNQAAPEPIFIGPGAGTGGRPDNISIDATNPYNPTGVTLDAGSNFILLGRRPLEGGPRVFEQNVNTHYLGTGFQGDFILADRFFSWDVNYIYSRNRADQTTHGTYNARNIALALGPVSECNADPFCVPLNLFGGAGSITQEMLDYIQVTAHDISQQELSSWTANLSGEITELPGGMMGFAVGYEFRDQSGYYQPDAVTVAGDSNGVPSSPTAGSYDVSEFYGEIAAPLLANAPGAELLELSASARSSDYSTSGSTTTTKFGLRWKPVDSLLVRATVAEGFRAPTIGELFGSAARFDAVLTDPCSNYPASTEQVIRDNCAALGVPPSYTQPNPQISVTTGGNPDLQPETSDSATFGLVYSAPWAMDTGWSESLDFELTYYSIEVDGAISALDAQVQLDTCVRTLDPAACNGISRNSSGNIDGFNNRLTNIGAIETSGWDIGITYALPPFDIGSFNIVWNTSLVDEYIRRTPVSTGFQSEDLAGIERNDSAIPEWQSNIVVNWALSQWRATYVLRAIGPVTESCSDAFDDTPLSLTQLGLCSDPNFANESLSRNELGTTVYSDIQVTYMTDLLGVPGEFSLGFNNLFDKDPPTCLSCSLNGYDASTYDVPGRFMYAMVSLRL